MKQIFEMTDPLQIEAVLQTQSYGTLALSHDDKPYSLPLNFVYYEGVFYFHGAKSGRKIRVLQANSAASFSVTQAHALIPSFFSSDEQLACPATHFFKSVIAEGEVNFVEDYDEKVAALTALMQKLQPEGGYKPLHEEAYRKMIDATCVWKLVPYQMCGKWKFGQHLSEERFEKIVEHLQERGEKVDMKTVDEMKKLRSQ